MTGADNISSYNALRDPCPPKTRADLEYERLLAALAARCVSDMGKAFALALPFAEKREECRILRDEAAEATALLANAEPLPIEPLADVRGALGRVGAAGVLAPPEIRELGKALEAARALRRFLGARRSRVPALHAACSTDPTLDALADELASAFDPDGTLSDRASPRLRELRGEFHAARQRMLSRLDDVMSKYEGILQDRFVTEREGRYVIPVRSDAHERFPGIVHATSASGATLFVEPRAVIPMGNRLKVLEAEVEREQQAIYAKLSDRIGESLPSVASAVEATLGSARARRRARRDGAPRRGASLDVPGDHRRTTTRPPKGAASAAPSRERSSFGVRQNSPIRLRVGGAERSLDQRPTRDRRQRPERRRKDRGAEDDGPSCTHDPRRPPRSVRRG
jgi:DNA mismatch repair protein MutS2